MGHAEIGDIKLESTRQKKVKLERNPNPRELKLLVIPTKSKKAGCYFFTLSLPHVKVCEGITFSNSHVKVCAGEESDTGIEVFLGMLVADPVVFGKPRRRTAWLPDDFNGVHETEFITVVQEPMKTLYLVTLKLLF